MQKFKNVFFLLACMLFSVLLLAQNGSGKSAIGNTMRSNGRIYVVVAVMLTILAGLILYMVRLDRKITKLEKEN
jgi:hypothetical protein